MKYRNDFCFIFFDIMQVPLSQEKTNGCIEILFSDFQSFYLHFNKKINHKSKLLFRLFIDLFYLNMNVHCYTLGHLNDLFNYLHLQCYMQSSTYEMHFQISIRLINNWKINIQCCANYSASVFLSNMRPGMY